MPQVDWYVQGIEYANCNCDYGCPCQFESLPTHGHCKGLPGGRSRADRYPERKVKSLI